MSARSSLKRRETEHSRDRQQQMLLAIATFTRQHGYAPTLRELGALVGMRTPSAVRWQLDRLRAAGRCRHLGRALLPGIVAEEGDSR